MVLASLFLLAPGQVRIENGDEAIRVAEKYMDLMGYPAPFRVQRLNPPFPAEDPEQSWIVRLSDRSGFRLIFYLDPSSGKLRGTDFAPESCFTPKEMGPELSSTVLKERCDKFAKFHSGWLTFSSDFRKHGPVGYSTQIKPLVFGLPFLHGGPSQEVWTTRDGKIVRYGSNRSDPRVNASKPRISEPEAREIAETLVSEFKKANANHQERGRPLPPGSVTYSESGSPQLGYWQDDQDSVARLVWQVKHTMTLNSTYNWRQNELVFYIDALTGRRLPN